MENFDNNELNQQPEAQHAQSAQTPEENVPQTDAQPAAQPQESEHIHVEYSGTQYNYQPPQPTAAHPEPVSYEKPSEDNGERVKVQYGNTPYTGSPFTPAQGTQNVPAQETQNTPAQGTQNTPAQGTQNVPVQPAAQYTAPEYAVPNYAEKTEQTNTASAAQPEAPNSTAPNGAPQYNPGYAPQPNQQYYQYQPPQNPTYYAPQQKQYYTVPQKQDKKRGLRIFAVILAVCIALSVGVGIGYISRGETGSLISDGGSNDLTQNNGAATGDKVEIVQGTVPQRSDITPGENGMYTADQVAQLVSESVVNINVYNESGSAGAIASGIILDKNGYILSNDHIYSETPAAKFIITLSNDKAYEAVYVAGDTRSDLCVLKMTNPPEGLVPATFGDSDAIMSGDDVIAIGSPYGFSGSVTKGIVSTPKRRISFSNTDSTGATASYSMQVIQTDVAINSGSSGGAVVNMYGQVVGISSSKIVLSGYEGICFAIPANNAIKVAQSLIEYHTVKGRARLGITYTEITAADAIMNNMTSGLLIQSISSDSNLSQPGGLSQGDVVTKIDGVEILTADVALDIIDSKAAGDTITLTVLSSGSTKTVKATLLEDSSQSSYSTQVPETTTSVFPR